MHHDASAQRIVANDATIEPGFDEIRAFLAVVDTRSFRIAGRTLGLATSSVSRRVASLEEKLGARLLQRTSRRLALTEVGSAYYARVTSAVTGLRDAAEEVRNLQATTRGHLRITAPIDLAQPLGRMVIEFRAQHPDVTIEIEISQRMVDLVGEGFDLALRAGALTDSRLIARKVVDTAPLLIGASGLLDRHPPVRTPEDLAHIPFVLFQPWQTRAGFGRITLERGGEQKIVEVRAPIVTNDFTMIRDVVLTGEGIGAFHPLLISKAHCSGSLVRVLPEWTIGHGSLYVVHPSRTHLPAKTRVFREFANAWLVRETEQSMCEVKRREAEGP